MSEPAVDLKAAARRERYQANRRLGRLSEDGSLAPSRPPKVRSDGTFVRPSGREPEGFGWNEVRGVWLPDEYRASEEENDDDLDKYEEKSETEDDDEMQDEEDEELAREEALAPAAASAFTPVAASKPSNKKRKSTSPRRSPNYKADEDGKHPTSPWQEPYRFDELTLYERNRKPRNVVKGRIQRPEKALEQAFRCVICLGYIRNTRIVMECMHRFCEGCIEKSLRMGRNECPVCRVYVPSRRSLAPDPNFDRIIVSIMGQAVLEDTDEEDFSENKKDPQVAQILQQAIHRKRTLEESNTDDDDIEGTDMSKAILHTQVTEVPPLIQIHLVPHKDEYELEPLDLPFLKLRGHATIGVLKSFLREKLDTDLNVQVMAVMAGKPVDLTDWITLESVSRRLSDRHGEGDVLTLFYQVKPDTGIKCEG